MCKLTGCQRLRLEARFLRFVKRLPNGCMIWTGAQHIGGAGKAKKSRGGPYGSFSVGKDATGQDFNSRKAHIVWAFLQGKLEGLTVPPGFHLDHTCQSGTLCVSCTELVPDVVNLKRNWSKRKDRRKAAEVAAEATRERRARERRAKRRKVQKGRKRAAGNPA